MAKVPNKPIADNIQAQSVSEELEPNLLDSGSYAAQPVGDPEFGSDINHMDNVGVDISKLLHDGITNSQLVDELLNIDNNQLLPWRECHLPSCGIYYGWPNGIVRVRPMTQTAEKILTTQMYVASGEAIEYLFRECCEFYNNFDPAELLVGDRTFLLYYLRGITHGNIYEFALTCPNKQCSSTETYSYDLNELSSTIKYANKSLGLEPFRVQLPYFSEATKRDIYVELRFVRTSDLYAITRREKFKRDISAKPSVRARNQQNRNHEVTQQIDDALTESLERVIVSVCGVTDPIKIRQFIQKLHAMDTATIRMWLKDNTPSMDSSVVVICPKCKQEFSTELPISDHFFLPKKF